MLWDRESDVRVLYEMVLYCSRKGDVCYVKIRCTSVCVYLFVCNNYYD